MIEGSRIDHAGHHNDPAAQVHEVLAYDRAFTSVLDFIKKEETQTVMVSTSDHETGGLAAARRTFPILFPAAHKYTNPTRTPHNLPRIPLAPVLPRKRLPLSRASRRRIQAIPTHKALSFRRRRSNFCPRLLHLRPRHLRLHHRRSRGPHRRPLKRSLHIRRHGITPQSNRMEHTRPLSRRCEHLLVRP
jgi:hypothetical protein